MAKKHDKATLPGLVVVGSSAGGIEALSTLVATLPATFPAPLVLVLAAAIVFLIMVLVLAAAIVFLIIMLVMIINLFYSF